MRRSSLSSDFEPAFQQVMSKAAFGSSFNRLLRGDEVPELSRIIAEHDPRHVSLIEKQIKATVTEAASLLLRPRYPQRDSDVRRMVRSICMSSPEAAIPLSTVWSGYAREEAVKQISSIDSSFALALVLRRLNDWVPQVRRAAKNCIESALIKTKKTMSANIIVGCISNIVDSNRYGRSFAQQEAILQSLIDLSGVRDGWRKLILESREDDAARALRLAFQYGYFLGDAKQFAQNAVHPATRRIATKALIDGSFSWLKEGRMMRRMLQGPWNRDEIVCGALSDTSVEVVRVGLQYVVNTPTCEYFTEGVLRTFTRHADRSICFLAAYGFKKLGIDLIAEVRDILKSSEEPPYWAARLLSHGSDVRDGELIYASYKAVWAEANMDWLELAASLKYKPAICDLEELSLRSSDYDCARKATKLLVRTGCQISFSKLLDAAETGDFEKRKLGRFVPFLRLFQVIYVIAALTRAGDDQALESYWLQVHNKRAKGAFMPKRAEVAALSDDLADLPTVNARARGLLGLDQETLVIHE